MKVQINIEDQRIKDLLCNALEGGSNYWYEIESFVNPNKITVECRHLDLPFIEGCGLMIADSEGDMGTKLLNREAMEKGLNIMSEKYPLHFSNFMTENDDAETGDVFLQCALYGEIVFG
jgi:hypothetical protein